MVLDPSSTGRSKRTTSGSFQGQIANDLLCQEFVDFPMTGTGWDRPVLGL
jgi:hypothetical protein